MKPKLYQKICFKVPTAHLDNILDYMESEYALFPIMKKCFGVGNDNQKECEKCEDLEDCAEEAEARAERQYMG